MERNQCMCRESCKRGVDSIEFKQISFTLNFCTYRNTNSCDKQCISKHTHGRGALKNNLTNALQLGVDNNLV